MKKLVNNSVIEKCGECQYSFSDNVDDCLCGLLYSAPTPVDPDKIHPECPLSYCKVIDCQEINVEIKTTPKVRPNTMIDGSMTRTYDNIEKILIVKKAKEQKELTDLEQGLKEMREEMQKILDKLKTTCWDYQYCNKFFSCEECPEHKKAKEE